MHQHQSHLHPHNGFYRLYSRFQVMPLLDRGLLTENSENSTPSLQCTVQSNDCFGPSLQSMHLWWIWVEWKNSTEPSPFKTKHQNDLSPSNESSEKSHNILDATHTHFPQWKIKKGNAMHRIESHTSKKNSPQNQPITNDRWHKRRWKSLSAHSEYQFWLTKHRYGLYPITNYYLGIRIKQALWSVYIHSNIITVNIRWLHSGSEIKQFFFFLFFRSEPLNNKRMGSYALIISFFFLIKHLCNHSDNVSIIECD